MSGADKHTSQIAGMPHSVNHAVRHYDNPSKHSDVGLGLDSTDSESTDIPTDKPARVVKSAQPKRILFANSKGGCGKSTLATNLASYYAHRNIATTLIDYDPQGSSTQWLKQRSPHAPHINGIQAFKASGSTSTRNWQMKLPRDTRRVIIDTPAGLDGNQLIEQIKLSNIIIVPVLPSPVDIHAATRFIGSILLSGQFKNQNKQLVVLANRVRKNTRVLEKLDRFLNSLRLPQVGSIRDTQNYIYCADMGMGIVDLPPSRSQSDLQEWHDLVAWLELQLHSSNNEANLAESSYQNAKKPVSIQNKDIYTLI